MIRIAWCNCVDLPTSQDLPPDLHLFQVELKDLIYGGFDLLILDIKTCTPLEGLIEIYMTLGLPTVLLVDTFEEESAALNWLKKTDEVCRRDAIGEQIVLRLRRSFENNRLNNAIYLDPLTGLANRRKLDEYFNTFLISKDIAASLCLILLNIDHFKQINNLFGHGEADQILKKMGQLLRQCALGVGIIARTGGDEFVIGLQDGSLEQGKALAEFLRTQIEAYDFNGSENSITASFGVACGMDSSAKKLLQKADQCLFEAKSQGRNCVVTSREFDGKIAHADDQDLLFYDLENRIQVEVGRMTDKVISKARAIAKLYQEAADRDGLTGILNRGFLDRLLFREFEKARKYQRKLAVMLLDLDHFGQINKTYGFPTGDRSLKIAADVFRQKVRAGDWLTRYGGEEFCIVMPDTDLNVGCQVAERTRLALSQTHITAYNGQHFQITVSIGVVELREEDQDLITFLQRVSDKVNQAKQGGRNQIKF